MESITVPIRLPNGETADLRLVKNSASITGFSLVSLSDGQSPGIPASLFLVDVMKAYRRLDLICQKQARIIAKLEKSKETLKCSM